MTRPLPRLFRNAMRPGLLGSLVLAGLAACAPQGRDPAISSVSVPPSRVAAAGMPGQATAQGQATRDQAAIAAACRQEADRIIMTRDRGQLMREDERDNRLGSEASIFSRRAETDRLGRIFERDRLAAQCVQENTRGAPQR